MHFLESIDLDGRVTSLQCSSVSFCYLCYTVTTLPLMLVLLLLIVVSVSLHWLLSCFFLNVLLAYETF